MFFSVVVENKTKVDILNSWWPLNRGNNNRQVLIGTAKRWLWPQNKGFIYSIILAILSGLITGHFIAVTTMDKSSLGRPKGGCGRLIEVASK